LFKFLILFLLSLSLYASSVSLETEDGYRIKTIENFFYKGVDIYLLGEKEPFLELKNASLSCEQNKCTLVGITSFLEKKKQSFDFKYQEKDSSVIKALNIFLKN